MMIHVWATTVRFVCLVLILSFFFPIFLVLLALTPRVHRLALQQRPQEPALIRLARQHHSMGGDW